jgi:outer membrane protein assembly factor BamB
LRAHALAQTVPVAVTALAIAGVVWLARTLTLVDVGPRVPKESEIARTGPPRRAAGPPANARGVLTAGDGRASEASGSWQGFRGPNLNRVSSEEVHLAASWPDGLRVLWALELGEGHAGAAVHRGRVFILDYDREGQRDVLRSLSLDDGREIWSYAYPVALRRNHGMSRTVPAVSDDSVVTLGPKGHLTCVDAETGALRWAVDLVGRYGTRIPDWYAAQSPLIEGDRVIVAPAGPKVLMTALGLATGEAVWEARNAPGFGMTHAVITPMALGDRRIFLYAGMQGLAGVDASDGTVLFTDLSHRAVIARVPEPVVVGADEVLVCSGYDAGCAMLRLRDEGASVEVELRWKLDAEVLGVELHAPIFHDGHLYAVRPSGELVCVSTDGEVVWTSGARRRFYKGYGDWILAQGMLWILDSGSTRSPSGVLTLVDASPDGYRERASVKVLDGADAWAPMALAGGRLIVRDHTRMVCLDVREAAR